jgi:hypothetical protein
MLLLIFYRSVAPLDASIGGALDHVTFSHVLAILQILLYHARPQGPRD